MNITSSERARLDEISDTLVRKHQQTIADPTSTPRAKAEAVVSVKVLGLRANAPVPTTDDIQRMVRDEEAIQRLSPEQRAVIARADADHGPEGHYPAGVRARLAAQASR